MASYNLLKAADRKRRRAEVVAELAATQDGTWPRDSNDVMRYVHLPQGSPYSSSDTLQKQREYVAKLCRQELEYLDDLERRIRAGDPDVEGYEKA